eukprot:2487762-Prymnesium_polylepis.2
MRSGMMLLLTLASRAFLPPGIGAIGSSTRTNPKMYDAGDLKETATLIDMLSSGEPFESDENATSVAHLSVSDLLEAFRNEMQTRDMLVERLIVESSTLLPLDADGGMSLDEHRARRSPSRRSPVECTCRSTEAS